MKPRVHSMILNCITDIVDDSSSVVSLHPEVADKSTIIWLLQNGGYVLPYYRDPRRPSTNLAAEKVETTKKYKQIMWKQGGGSADHDFYIALITNNDSFKIWISEIERKKLEFLLKKRIFLLSLWFLERPESRFPFISLINDLKKKSPAAGFFLN